MNILLLDDIQKLKALDLRETLKANSELMGRISTDFMRKVYALLMWHVLPSSNGENLEQNQSDFKYEATMVRTLSNLHNLTEVKFIQLYDYPVVSTQKYCHIVLRGMHYKKLKSYQFFFEGNMKNWRVKFLKTKFM